MGTAKDTTYHLARVTIHRVDRPEAPIDAGTAEFHGQPYDFTGADARAALIADGRLSIGSDLTTFGDVLVPTPAVERIVVSIEAASRPPTPEEAAAFKEAQEAAAK